MPDASRECITASDISKLWAVVTTLPNPPITFGYSAKATLQAICAMEAAGVDPSQIAALRAAASARTFLT